MLKVSGLRKLPENQMKQEYELMLKDLENTKPGYTFETVYGTEAEVRTMLKNGEKPGEKPGDRRDVPQSSNSQKPVNVPSVPRFCLPLF